MQSTARQRFIMTDWSTVWKASGSPDCSSPKKRTVYHINLKNSVNGPGLKEILHRNVCLFERKLKYVQQIFLAAVKPARCQSCS
jgi:hypothetical protein